MSKFHISATVNGEAVEYLCDPKQTLLDVLRDELNLTGSKEGCSSGDCGACSVMLDGRLVCSCLVLGVEMQGRVVETIENMASDENCIRCSRNSWRKRRCNAASAHRDFWLRPKPCWKKILTRPNQRRVTGWREICAAARAMTKSSARCLKPPPT